MFNETKSRLHSWGTSLLLHCGDAYNLSLLSLEPKKNWDTLCDQLNERTYYCQSGSVKVILDPYNKKKKCTLLPGLCLHIDRGVPFKFEATEISRLIEVSSKNIPVLAIQTTSISNDAQVPAAEPNNYPKFGEFRAKLVANPQNLSIPIKKSKSKSKKLMSQ